MTSAGAAASAADWEALGIDPTSDADAVRRAYRARLRTVGPETDPEGFQALRAAYEAILAAVGTGAPPPARNDGDGAAATAATFITALDARRAAGDEAGAIALVDETLAAHPAGSAAAEAIEDVLLDQVAFSRNVSPGLFRHLADRLDWRDIGGHAARRDPERHAFLLDRIAAEDWYHALSAGDPERDRWGEGRGDRRIETILAGDRERAASALAGAPLSGEQRQHVRDLFEQLRSHATFVLVRFDGGTLALLREAVEGPPLLGDAATPAPPPAAPVASIAEMVSPERRWLIRLAVIAILAVVFAGRLLYKSSPTYRGTDTALAANVALPILKNPKTAWVDLIPGPDGVKVDWAPVMRMRHAIAELHVGYNDELPTTLFALPDVDAPIGFIAPDAVHKIAMRIRYIDGKWSEVRRYDIDKAKR